jgi:LysM repeat protein
MFMQKPLDPQTQGKAPSLVKKVLDIPFTNWFGVVGFAMGAVAMIAFFAQRTDVELLKAELRDFNAKAHVTQMEENVNKLVDKATYQEAQIQSIVEQVQKEVDRLNQNLQKTNLAVSKQGQVIKRSLGGVSKAKKATHISKQKEPVEKVTSASAADKGDWTSHTVKPGDTFAKIAKQYGVSVKNLQSANPHLNSSHLKVGNSVRIP